MPALPGPLDAVVEGWWRLPIRIRAAAVVALAALVVFGIARRTTSTPFGPVRLVAVASSDMRAGTPVVADLMARPATLVPDDALAEVPEGMLARDITAGEVVTTRHLATGIDGLLESEEVAIALPDDLPPLPAHARLEVLATALDGTATRLGAARLLATDQDWLWIAVAAPMAPDVAAAMARGGVALAVAPP